MGLIYNRDTKQTYDDKQYMGGGLDFLYNNMFGRILLRICIGRTMSCIYGAYMKLSVSRIHIRRFIDRNNIDMNRFETRRFSSFNDFFTRRLKNLEFDKSKDTFCAPAESKLLVYSIDENMSIPIKKGRYSLGELIGKDDKSIADRYKGGHCLVFRLAVDDYHRYHYVDSGRIIESYPIRGLLHTISSYSDEYKVFAKNYRVCNRMMTDNFGEIIYIEVGAMFVGKIVNSDTTEFKKGEEKGHFEPGGSTIVILCGPNVLIDEDIINNSIRSIETKVSCMETIGKANN